MEINKRNILFKGLSTSAISKGVGFVYQIITLPLLLSYMGAESFGLLSIFMTLVGWVYLMGGGISPYVTRVIAVQASINKINKVISCSRTILVILSIILSIIVLIISAFSEVVAKDTFSATLIFIFSVFIANFSIADSIRQGQHQQHINNLIHMFSQVTTVALIYIFISSDFLIINKVFTITIAIYLPLFIFKLLNIISLKGSYFNEPLFLSYGKYRKYYKVINQFVVANLSIQVSVILVKSVAIILLGLTSLNGAAQMEIVFRYLLIAGTFFATIQTVIWPLMSHAEKKRDFKWLKNVKLMLGVGFCGIGILNVLIITFWGDKVFDIWLGKQMILSHNEIIMTSYYFLAIALAQAPIIILMGKGKFARVGKALMVEATIYTMLTTYIYITYQSITVEETVIAMIFVRVLVFIQLARAAYAKQKK